MILEERATLKFTPEEQGMFCKINPDAIFSSAQQVGKNGMDALKI
jgi:hypothetical protein